MRPFRARYNQNSQTSCKSASCGYRCLGSTKNKIPKNPVGMAEIIATGFNPGVKELRLLCVLAATTVNNLPSLIAKTPTRLVQHHVSEPRIIIPPTSSEESGIDNELVKRGDGRDYYCWVLAGKADFFNHSGCQNCPTPPSHLGEGDRCRETRRIVGRDG